MADNVRLEKDTFGEIAVPADRLWGAQTQRSLQNFRISVERQPIELIRALRGESAYRHTPILMLTTEAGPDRKKEGKEAGATGWIVKPFDPAQLVATMHRVLR